MHALRSPPDFSTFAQQTQQRWKPACFKVAPCLNLTSNTKHMPFNASPLCHSSPAVVEQLVNTHNNSKDSQQVLGSAAKSSGHVHQPGFGSIQDEPRGSDVTPHLCCRNRAVERDPSHHGFPNYPPLYSLSLFKPG